MRELTSNRCVGNGGWCSNTISVEFSNSWSVSGKDNDELQCSPQNPTLRDANYPLVWVC